MIPPPLFTFFGCLFHSLSFFLNSVFLFLFPFISVLSPFLLFLFLHTSALILFLSSFYSFYIIFSNFFFVHYPFIFPFPPFIVLRSIFYFLYSFHLCFFFFLQSAWAVVSITYSPFPFLLSLSLYFLFVLHFLFHTRSFIFYLFLGVSQHLLVRPFHPPDAFTSIFFWSFLLVHIIHLSTFFSNCM